MPTIWNSSLFEEAAYIDPRLYFIIFLLPADYPLAPFFKFLELAVLLGNIDLLNLSFSS